MFKSKKDFFEFLCAVLILFVTAVIGYHSGRSIGYDAGLSEGVAIDKGDKWDCAYIHSTGFLLCDRTPKYK